MLLFKDISSLSCLLSVSSHQGVASLNHSVKASHTVIRWFLKINCSPLLNRGMVCCFFWSLRYIGCIAYYWEIFYSFAQSNLWNIMWGSSHILFKCLCDLFHKTSLTPEYHLEMKSLQARNKTATQIHMVFPLWLWLQCVTCRTIGFVLLVNNHTCSLWSFAERHMHSGRFSCIMWKWWKGPVSSAVLLSSAQWVLSHELAGIAGRRLSVVFAFVHTLACKTDAVKREMGALMR